MELDDLKARWQQDNDRYYNLKKQKMEGLKLMLAEKTTGTLAGTKKKYEKIISYLLVGILFNVLLNPFLHFLLGEEGPVFRITFGGLLTQVTLVFFGLIVIFFYWFKYTRLNTTLPANDLRENLTQNITHLKSSLQQEIIFIIMLFLVIFIIGRLSSAYLGNGAFGDIWHLDIMLAMLAGFAIMVFYIYKRTKAYQENIRELKQYLAEFEENANG